MIDGRGTCVSTASVPGSPGNVIGNRLLFAQYFEGPQIVLFNATHPRENGNFAPLCAGESFFPIHRNFFGSNSGCGGVFDQVAETGNRKAYCIVGAGKDSSTKQPLRSSGYYFRNTSLIWPSDEDEFGFDIEAAYKNSFVDDEFFRCDELLGLCDPAGDTSKPCCAKENCAACANFMHCSECATGFIFDSDGYSCVPANTVVPVTLSPTPSPTMGSLTWSLT